MNLAKALSDLYEVFTNGFHHKDAMTLKKSMSHLWPFKPPPGPVPLPAQPAAAVKPPRRCALPGCPVIVDPGPFCLIHVAAVPAKLRRQIVIAAKGPKHPDVDRAMQAIVRSQIAQAVARAHAN